MSEPDAADPTPTTVDRRPLIVAGVALGVAAVIAVSVIAFARPTTSGTASPAAPIASTSSPTDPAQRTADPAQSPSSQAPESSASAAPGPTVAGAPDGSTPCPVRYPPTGLYRASSVGTGATSCGFAEEVRAAYARSGRPGQLPRPITARSPETGADIEMLCAAQAKIVTCTGGVNAVVYLY
ncbi:hypothetical protein [Williamsia sp. CHRR-6]|uniref:hypothetical protein n=1 Tax=Williamsia sp. CHRR-6 TaxID=2835871 RepID=UPI001BDB0A40|nr:hypothetical protein [Williamsia sp. CHRR-6]MBT0566695.1 hypothetical protein [Williamsia sp. CHRR-6]